MAARKIGSGVVARETRSTTARQRAVSPSSSSDDMEIVGEVPTPASALTRKPRTQLLKRLALRRVRK